MERRKISEDSFADEEKSPLLVYRETHLSLILLTLQCAPRFPTLDHILVTKHPRKTLSTTTVRGERIDVVPVPESAVAVVIDDDVAA